MSTAVVVDEDVKVWIAARLIAHEKPEFSAADVSARAQKLFGVDAKKTERFLQDRCVANTAGVGEKHYNYLYRVGTGKYRMFRQGDPIEFSHAMAPTTPEVSRVPPEYKALFAAAPRFAPEVRPVAAAPTPAPAVAKPTAPAPTKAATPASRSAVKAPPRVGKPTAPKPSAPALAPVEQAPPEPPTAGGLKPIIAALDQQAPANLARKTIFDMLFLEFGKLGSQLEANEKSTFTVQHEGVSGSVQTQYNVTVKMPSGRAVGHIADLVVELESPAKTLFIDIVEAAYRPDDLKAHAWDVLHLKKDSKQRYSVLVFLRTPNGTLQEQAEAIGYPYDFFFGVDAMDVKNASKFYALKAQILQWLQGKAKPAAV